MLVVYEQDFFGQLRASGSGDFVSYALDGLSTGLQTSSVALQVFLNLAAQKSSKYRDNILIYREVWV